MSFTIEPIKPHIGSRVHVDRARICDDEVVDAVHAALEQRHVLVFPGIGLADDEQLAFTDKLSGRIEGLKEFRLRKDSGKQEIYKVTLDRKIHHEPDYVLGTFFWHIDGVHVDAPISKGTLLSARTLSATGGQTEFCNLYAAYEELPEAEKVELEALRVIHSLEASMRPIYGNLPEKRLRYFREYGQPMEHPLVWTHEDGRKSLLLGTHADGIVGYPGAAGRAKLVQLHEWAAQPQFIYRHEWQDGDLVLWNNHGLMHRVVPYPEEEGRIMHRTSLGGFGNPGKLVSYDAVDRIHAAA